MARTFNTKLTISQIALQARTGAGTGGLSADDNDALKIDWDNVPDKSSVDTRISTESSTRSSSVASLTTRVSTEESTRTANLSSVDTRLGGMSGLDFTSSDARISTETSTRLSADDSLTTRISTEESTRTNLQSNVSTNLSTEVSVRSSSVISLDSRVSTETSTRSSSVTSIDTRVSTETSTRSSSVTSIDTRVSTETSTRSSSITSLDTRVSTEISTRGSADTSLASRLTNIESGYVNGVQFKASYASLAAIKSAILSAGVVDGYGTLTFDGNDVSGWAYYDESGNDSYILVSLAPDSNEGRLVIDASISSHSLVKHANFSELSGLVSTEESSRISADTSLTNRISTETSTRSSSVTSIDSRVSTETSTRLSADDSLTTRISTEESARTALQSNVSTAISTETSTRTSSVSSLTTRVSTEESTRSSSVTSLDSRVSTETSTRSSSVTSIDTRVSTETSTRSSSVTSLTTRISSEESTRASTDTLIQSAVMGYQVAHFKVDSGLTITSAGNLVNFDSSTALYKSSSFDFKTAVCVASPSSPPDILKKITHRIYVNGMLMRPEFSAGNYNFKTSGTYTPTNGDYVLYNDSTNGGVQFSFSLLAGDIIKVEYGS